MKDIKINNNTEDIELTDSVPLCFDDVVSVIEEEYTVDITILAKNITTRKCFYINLPYIPSIKPVRVRIGDGDNYINTVSQIFRSSINEQLFSNDNSNLLASYMWFDTVQKASELITVNSDWKYKVILDDEKKASIYSAKESELQIISNASQQNISMMLKCHPGKNYRYPITGVGLLKYLHSNLNQFELANKIKTELNKDGIEIESADYDFYTGELNIK